MIKGRGVMFLDGDFKKETPEHGVSTFRDEKGKWSVTRFGPKYRNVYEVTEYDEVGERWLNANAESQSGRSPKTGDGK